MTWEGFLTTKLALWIDTRSSIDNTLHGSGREVDKGILLQIKKAPEASGGNLTCHVFSLKNAVAHLSVTDPRKILTIETYLKSNFIALKRAIKFFDISLVDPFFVDCIVLGKSTTHYSTSKFHDIHGIQRRLWWFTFAVFSK